MLKASPALKKRWYVNDRTPIPTRIEAAIAHLTTVRREAEVFDAPGPTGTAATPYRASLSDLRQGMHSCVIFKEERAGRR
jgi:hypothetical protein